MAHSIGVVSLVMGPSRPWELEVAGHILLTVRRQRGVNEGVLPFHEPFYAVQDFLPTGWHCYSERVFSSELIQSG